MCRLFFIACLIMISINLISEILVCAEDSVVDILRLENGQQLTGQSLSVGQGALTWQSKLGHELLIPLDIVERLEYNVPLQDGDDWQKSDRELRYQQALDQEKSVGHMRMGRAEFEYFMLRTVFWDLSIGVSDLISRAMLETAEWTKRVGLGGRFVDGNNNQDFFNLEGIFERKHGHRQTQFDLGGQYNQMDDDKASNRWYGNATIDFARETKWIFFVSSKHEYDEFENLNYRGTLSSGFGYRFFNEKKKRLLVRIGPAVTYENFADERDRRTSPDVLAEFEGRWPLFERVDCENKATVYPNAETFDRFRLVNIAGLLLRLDQNERWRLKLGLRIEYESEPGQEQENVDYTSNISLVYTRK